MSRVKRGVTANKKRKGVLAMTKGYRFGRSKKEALAKEAIRHAGSYAFRDRRDKKSTFRNLWNLKINAAARPLNISYSKLMGALKKKGIVVDRKILAQLAEFEPDTFAKVVAEVK